MDILNAQHLNALFGDSKFGASPEEAIVADLYGMSEDDITKALATSGSIGTDGSSLIGESLDPVVKVITLSAENFTPMLRRYYTFQAKAITEQFTRILSLGTSGGSWRPEGSLGVEDSILLERKTQNVKFLGQTGIVTREMMNASKAKFGDVKALQAVGRLNKLLLDFERDAIWGNSTINALSFQGILQQMNSGSTYNINKVTTGLAGARTTYTAGGSIGSADIRSNAEAFLTTGGVPSVVYAAPADKYSISAEQDNAVRWYKEDQRSSQAYGMVVDQIHTDFGWVDVVWDFFLKYYRGQLSPTPEDPTDTTKFHSQAPAIPGTAPTGAAAAAGYLPVDTYYYGVSFVNENGEGPIKLQSTGYTTDNTNGKVNVTVTLPASVADIRSIRLYRSTTNGTDYLKMRLVKEDALTGSGGGTQVVVDDGSLIPGSRTALMMNENMSAMGLLEPPNIRDLADIDNTHRFTISAMAVLMLYNEYNVMRWYNIGGSVTDPA